ncbi:MAG: DNA repair exonuclease SbcCD ATPase subunit [Candidatus Nitrosomirales archaeon]|jgi:DNA repair exonuclease SbcCD ATPase subunit
MKIKKLVVKGFMRFKDQEIVNFPENQVTLIFGENGAGKTSLLDAICVCLYGRTFRTSFDSEAGFLRPADLVNHDVTKATIHFEFENHGHNFVVRREITKDKSDGELLEDGELKAEKDDVYEYVSDKAIGLDWEGFSKSTVILQGEMNALTDVLPATRKEAFMKLFGLAKYSEYEKSVRNEIGEKKISVEKMDAANEVLTNEIAKIPQVENSIKRLKKTIAGLEQQVTSSGRKAKQITNLRKNLEKDYRTYIALNGKIDSINKQKNNAERTLEHRKNEYKELNGLRNEFPSLERSYKEFAALTKSMKGLKAKKSSYDRIDGKLFSLKNLLREKKEKFAELLKDIEISRTFLTRLKKEVPSSKQVSSIREETAGLERKKVQLEEGRYRLEALLNVLNNSINDMKAEMGRIKRRNVCPTCSQKMPSAKSVLRHYMNEINMLAADRTKKQRELSSILIQLKKVSRALGSVESARSRIESVYSKQSELLNEVKRLDALSTRRDKVKHEIEVVSKEVEKFSKQLGSLHFNAKEYGAMEKRLGMLRQEKIAERYSSASVQLRRLPSMKSEIDKTSKLVSSLEKQRKQLLAQIKKLKDIEHRFAAVKEELRSAQSMYNQNIVTLMKEKTNYTTLTKQYTELKNKEKKLQQNEDEIEKLQEDASLLEDLVSIFKNIPENILHRLIPYIEKEGTAIINDLSEGMITALNIERDTLNIGATMGGEVRPIQYFSGGQQTRINMALRVAISRILSKLPQTEDAFATMQTLIIDEGDFGNLDDAGIRDVMNVLQNMTKEFSRIVLINHLESVRENFRGYTVEVIKTGASQSKISAPIEETVSVQREAV